MAEKKTALITGGNRGIGFEVCRQLGKKGFKVLLGARNQAKGEEATKKLISESLDIEFIQLDVDDPKSIQKAYSEVEKKFGRLDALVNNAGVFLDERGKSALEGSPETILKTFVTNSLGPFLLSQKFIPLMVKNKYGRVVNMSSGMGQLDEMESGYPSYRISKTALNAVTKIMAEETRGTNVLVNSMCPGWVRTDMGGQEAERSPEEGADTAVWLATLPGDGPTGGFFRDRESIPW